MLFFIISCKSCYRSGFCRQIQGFQFSLQTNWHLIELSMQLARFIVKHGHDVVKLHLEVALSK